MTGAARAEKARVVLVYRHGLLVTVCGTLEEAKRAYPGRYSAVFNGELSAETGILLHPRLMTMQG